MSALLCAGAYAQQVAPKPFDRWALSRVRTILDARLSPSGDQIAFVLESPLLTEDVYRTDVQLISLTGGSPRRISSQGRFNGSPSWAPDSLRLAYISDHSGTRQIWMHELGAEPRQVTNLPTAVDRVVYSPDGERLFFTSRVFPDCGADDSCNRTKLAALAEGGNVRVFDGTPLGAGDGRVSALFSLSLIEADAAPALIAQPANGVSNFAVSPDGQEVCFVAINPSRPSQGLNTDLYTVSAEGGDPVRITAGDGGDRAPLYSPDGLFIAFLSQVRPAYPTDRYRLTVYNRNTGETAELTSSLESSVSEAAWSPDSTRLFLTAADQGRRPAYTVRADGGGLRMIVYGNASHSSLQVTPDGQSIVYLAQSASRPAELVQGFATGEQPRQITHLNDGLFEEFATGEVNEVKWSSADGAEISGFLVTPKDLDFNSRYPLLTILHRGAGDWWGERWRTLWNAQLIAGGGYIVFLPNVRGSGGYGDRFSDATRADWTDLASDDLIAGVEQVLARPYVDSRRLAIAANGRSTALLASIFEKTGRFRAVAVHGSMVDPAAAYGSAAEPVVETWRLYGNPANKPDSYQAASVWPRLDGWKVPTVLTHVEGDPLSPASQSRALFRALHASHVPARLVLLQGDSEGRLTPRSQSEWSQQVLGWLGRSFEPEPATSPDSASAQE